MIKENSKDKIIKAILTSYEDRHIQSDKEYRTQFIYNDFKNGRKVLSTLENELCHCDEFLISVAFITKSGLISLLPTLRELEKRGIPGRIITTDYLHFSDPSALEQLLTFSNIELRLYQTDSQVGFHTKGYIFKKDDLYSVIVGSSNLTASALSRNEEWNTKMVANGNGEYLYLIKKRFGDLWNSENCTDYGLVKDEYRDEYKKYKQKQKEQAIENDITGDDIFERKINDIALKPNSMQKEFVENMNRLYDAGEKRALLISATGTGKTYASAFAVKDYAPKRLLFIVHREQIAKQALKSYRKVLGKSVSMGLLSGNHRDIDRDYIFSTMQTVSKEHVYSQFPPDAFDYIVIDEVHRAGAKSYETIINYFKPKMLLGMTATPDRSDGFDIYSLFNHNIAYEIRLQQALEEDMLCPFHYFGITDIQLVDNPDLEDDKLASFARLTSDERVKHILREIDFYGHSGDRVKGLIFCSRNEEAEELSRKFNQCGRRTVNLSGSNSQEEREEAIDRLVSDDREDFLEYIFTVDIFNEGVDVPEINQVVMLRPTQSPIVFIQQLGRGLRQNTEKEYVVILDFIGNYMGNNFMIPMALSGDKTYNKDNIRRCLMEGSKIIPGASTIHFDEISKKRIFKSIDATNISDLKRIKESYINLKNKLGRIPSLMDFDTYGEMDLVCLFQNSGQKSYHNFLKKYDKDYNIELSGIEEKFIEFISCEWAEGKRPHELELLNVLMNESGNIFYQLAQKLKDKWKLAYKPNTAENLINIMTANFMTGTGAKTYEDCVFIEENDGDYTISDVFAECLQNDNFKRMVEELIEFGLHRYKKNYSKIYKDSGFQLYQKYEYKDVCRLLNWSQNVVPQNIGGYKYDDTTKTLPVFINYDKADDVQDSINYHDRFVNNGQLISLSKSRRSKKSKDVQQFINANDLGIVIDLFVRKNKEDKGAKSFYYLGRMNIQDAKDVQMQGAGVGAVEMFWNLEVNVREDIYDYITSENL